MELITTVRSRAPRKVLRARGNRDSGKVQRPPVDEGLHGRPPQRVFPSNRARRGVRSQKPSTRHLHDGRMARTVWDERTDGHHWPQRVQERDVHVQGHGSGWRLTQALRKSGPPERFLLPPGGRNYSGAALTFTLNVPVWPGRGACLQEWTLRTIQACIDTLFSRRVARFSS